MRRGVRRILWVVFSVAMACRGLPVFGESSGTSLAAVFDDPPVSARPATWWHWMNGNVTREGITLDLEWMARVGLAGPLIFETGQAALPGAAVQRSAYWQECVRHAVKECARLGLELGMHNCSGWSCAGGPWVDPEDSMKKLVFSRAVIEGGARHPAAPARPAAEAILPFSHQNDMNAKLEEYGFERVDYAPYYEDVAVFAWPAGDERLMEESAPRLDRGDVSLLLDGNVQTGVCLDEFRAGPDAELTVRFPEPFKARSLYLESGEWGIGCSRVELLVRQSGTLVPVTDFKLPLNGGPLRTMHGIGFDAVEGREFVVRFAGVKAKKRPADLRELRLSGSECIDSWPVKAGFLRGNGQQAECTESRPAIDSARLLDLSDRLRPDGTLDWETPAGRWMVLRIGATSTGKMNHPAAVGGLGLEVDKFDPEALERFFENGLMGMAVGLAGDEAGRALTSFGTDSWEVGAQNWTPKMVQFFEARRGYDPTPWLPCLAGYIVKGSEATERFLRDWRKTCSDLFAEHFYGGFRAFCRRYGMQSFAEPYNSANYNNLQMGGYVDDAAAVFWTDHRFSETGIRQMASLANTYGLGRVEAEAYTSTGDSGMWRNYPASMKARGDRAFSLGVSRFVFHTSAHQPWVDTQPGMTMGPFGINFTRTTTWAEQAKAWVEYITRCQAMLQSGLAAVDILFFVGEDSPNDFSRSRKHLKVPDGYLYDGCDAAVLLKRASVEDGCIVLPDGMRYRLLVLADEDAMSVEMAEKIRELVTDGATVLAKQKPVRTPGVGDDAALERIVGELFGPLDGEACRDRVLGRGRLVMGRPIAQMLTRLELSPDYLIRNAPDGAVGVAHRYVEDADFYFVSCNHPSPVDFEVSFRVENGVPELWNPYAKTRRLAADVRHEDGRTVVPLRFDPDDAVFVVFPDSSSTSEKAVRFEPESQMDLAGPWDVVFQPGRGAPESIRLPELVDLSAYADDGVNCFSGTAVYTTEFEFAGPADAARQVVLDLGRVEVLAEVVLNGVPLGTFWKRPFNVDVTEAVRSGRNRLEVRVTNLWINRMIGDERQFPVSDWFWWAGEGEWPAWVSDPQKKNPVGRIAFAAWPHWRASDELYPSGLIGPVRLMTGRCADSLQPADRHDVGTLCRQTQRNRCPVAADFSPSYSD